MDKQANMINGERIFRLPNDPVLCRRLEEKRAEYQRRLQHYLESNEITGLGVLVGTNREFLDAYYKEVLFTSLLERHIIRIQDIYEFAKRKLHGFVNDPAFANAVSVLKDYLRTGGINTSGGSGFMSKTMFRELLKKDSYIILPEDEFLPRFLQKKYHEYLGRIAEAKLRPELAQHPSLLKRDTYKAHIISALRQHGRVNLRRLAKQIWLDDKEAFDYQQYYRATEVIRYYCKHGEEGMLAGTGV